MDEPSIEVDDPDVVGNESDGITATSTGGGDARRSVTRAFPLAMTREFLLTLRPRMDIYKVV